MYAVVSSGGKQYRVEPGGTLLVERLEGEPGAPVAFERVLLVGDGERVTVGTPTVSGATVLGTILGEERGPKLIVFKYRQKARYRRKAGHRQHLTRVRIDSVQGPDGGARAARSGTRREAGGADATGSEPAAKPRRRRRATTEEGA